MTDVTCTACGDSIGRGPGGLGMVSHWQRHRREYSDAHPDERGRPSKADVREWLSDGFTSDATIEDGQTQLIDFTFAPASMR